MCEGKPRAEGLARRGPGPEQDKNKIIRKSLARDTNNEMDPSPFNRGCPVPIQGPAPSQWSPFPHALRLCEPHPSPLTQTQPSREFQGKGEKIYKSEQLFQSFDLSLKRLEILKPNWAETGVCGEGLPSRKREPPEDFVPSNQYLC